MSSIEMHVFQEKELVMRQVNILLKIKFNNFTNFHNSKI